MKKEKKMGRRAKRLKRYVEVKAAKPLTLEQAIALTRKVKKTERMEAAEPLTIRAQMVLRRIKRAQLIMKRKKKYGKQYMSRRDFHAPPIHKGPCVATKIVQYDPGLLARVFKGQHKTYRVIAGKGHRMVGHNQFGDRVWHPRYADIKRCIVCGMTLKRVNAPKAGA